MASFKNLQIKLLETKILYCKLKKNSRRQAGVNHEKFKQKFLRILDMSQVCTLYAGIYKIKYHYFLKGSTLLGLGST